MHQGVADPRLTAWLLRLTMSTRRRKIPRLLCSHAAAVRKESSDCETANDPDGNRTRVTAVKGRCLNRLTTGPLFSSSVAEPFLILSYNFYNCKSFFLILSILKMSTLNSTFFHVFIVLPFCTIRSLFYCIFSLLGSAIVRLPLLPASHAPYFRSYASCFTSSSNSSPAE